MENPKVQRADFAGYKVAVLATIPGRMIFEIDIRARWKKGMTPAECLADCYREKLVHNREKAPIGRPRTVGVKRGRYLPHATVMRRLADAMHYAACKLLKHALEEDDLAMVRKLKADCERTVFGINGDGTPEDD